VKKNNKKSIIDHNFNINKKDKMLDKFFKITEKGSSIKTEIIAGITTFLTMSYIIVLNPDVLSMAGMDKGAVFTATIIAAIIGSLIMGLYANYPVVLAPGVGLSAFFTFGVVMGMGHKWEVALGAVFLSGIIFFLISVFKLRQWVVESIPMTLRYSIAAGIGFFLAMIALKNSGLVVDHPATFVTLGDVTRPESLLTLVGLLLIAVLAYRKVIGAVMIAIIAITVIALMLGMVEVNGFMSMPPSLEPTYMKLDIAAAFDIAMISIIFAFLFVDLFDTSGTLIAVAHQGKMLDKDGKLPNMKKAMTADSVASIIGSGLGTSTTTSFIESGSGISAGGRTGLTAVVAAGLFFVALFFSPIVSIVPPYATAPALLFVAVLMSAGLGKIDWSDLTEAVPVLVTVLMMPFTFSIVNGVAFGFISFVVMKLLTGKSSELNVGMYAVSGLFIAKFAFL
jgi:AGZA family xanthine/uracil permease-like MFS transporter